MFLLTLFLDVNRLKTAQKAVVINAQAGSQLPEDCLDVNRTYNFDMFVNVDDGDGKRIVLTRPRHLNSFTKEESAYHNDDYLEEKLHSRPLKVSFAAYPPLTVRRPDGRFAGANVEMWNVAASHLGLDIEYVDVGAVPKMIVEV